MAYYGGPGGTLAFSDRNFIVSRDFYGLIAGGGLGIYGIALSPSRGRPGNIISSAGQQECYQGQSYTRHGHHY